MVRLSRWYLIISYNLTTYYVLILLRLEIATSATATEAAASVASTAKATSATEATTASVTAAESSEEDATATITMVVIVVLTDMASSVNDMSAVGTTFRVFDNRIIGIPRNNSRRYFFQRVLMAFRTEFAPSSTHNS